MGEQSLEGMGEAREPPGPTLSLSNLSRLYLDALHLVCSPLCVYYFHQHH